MAPLPLSQRTHETDEAIQLGQNGVPTKGHEEANLQGGIPGGDGDYGAMITSRGADRTILFEEGKCQTTDPTFDDAAD